MTPPTDLPRRFAASRNWKWEKGMHGHQGHAFIFTFGLVGSVAVPILNPPTKGCILDRIRRLRGDSTICPCRYEQGWVLESGVPGGILTDFHDTEEEAYLDALEGCP